jgi:hypothetical protein
MIIKLHLNENIEWACNLHFTEFKFINLNKIALNEIEILLNSNSNSIQQLE